MPALRSFIKNRRATCLSVGVMFAKAHDGREQRHDMRQEPLNQDPLALAECNSVSGEYTQRSSGVAHKALLTQRTG